MNILILGSGGREHALAWATLQNPKCDKLIVAPGNAGIAQIAECARLDTEDGAAVAEFASENSIDLVIIGPEAPLAAGVADTLRGAGFAVFGPSAAAARLEASKSFTKEICDAANAPTAAYGHFTDADAAKAHVREQGAPIVVKADGLAAGKGVIINNLLPGIHATDRAVSLDTAAAALNGITLEEAMDRRAATIPAGRYGTAEEFGATCAFLCSQYAGYIVGQNILLDGGSTNATL